MISLLQHYKRSLVWFLSGLVMAFLISLGTSHQQPASAQPALISEFAATHQEPNFYQ